MRIKFKNLFVILLTIFMLLPVMVDAQGTITLKSSKTDLTIDDEVVITASVPKGVNSYALMATLKYDTNVFQKIDETNFVLGSTESISYNPDNNKFGIINRAGEIASSGILFEVHLKVKTDANVGDTNIALTNISSSTGGGSKTTFPTTSIKLSVTRDAKEGEAIPTDQENVISEDSEKVIEASTYLPVLVVLIIAFVTLGVYLFIYSRKDEKNKKVLWSLIGSEVLVLIGVSVLLIFNYNKQDVNNDGVKDYQDAEEIIDYLIDMAGTKEEKEKLPSEDNKPVVRPSQDYDTNNDGKVDVEDVGQVVEDVNKKTNVVLTEYNVSSEYYIDKSDITLMFTAKVSPEVVQVKQIKVNDTYYDVTLVDGVYSLAISVPMEAGKYDFVISEVLLDNGKTVKTSLTMSREILKEAPYVNKVNLDSESGTLSFELEDIDDAFISGTTNIYKGNDLIASKAVEKDKTTVPFEANDSDTYIIEITGSYDLDSNQTDGNNTYTDQQMYTKSFVIGGDYNFTLTDVSITDAVHDGEIPTISFYSTNNRGAKVTCVNLTVDGQTKNYVVTKNDGNYYEVKLLDAPLTTGKHTVTLNDVELDSVKTFYNGTDYTSNTLTYTVLKDAPKVDGITLSDNSEGKSINVSFNYQDTTSATDKLTVVLVDSIGQIVAKQDITKEEYQDGAVTLSLSYDNNPDGFYTVKVLADYTLADSYTYTNISLGEDSILVAKGIYIEKMYVTDNNNRELSNNLYVTKNQKNYQIAIELHIDDSINQYARAKYKNRGDYSRISTITINGLNYQASQISGCTKSKVYLTVPMMAGTIDIKATRVQLTLDGYYNMLYNDQFSVPAQTITIEVLKDKPKIENLVITDDYDNSQAIFDFDVVLDETATETENDFNNGTIQLGSNSSPIHPGHNTVTFNDIERDQNYDLTFKASYDLDTDALNDKTEEKNEYKDDTLLTVKYGLYDKATYDDIVIEDAKVISEKGNSYFEKNEKIKLDFAIAGIDSNIEASLAKVIIDNKEYVVTQNGDRYELILDGYYSFGQKEITITDIILSNGKKVTLSKSQLFQPEVLKDKVSITDFTYETIDNKVKVTLALKDVDNSLIDSAVVVITDEDGKTVYSGTYQDTITFDKTQSLRYYVRVMATYDRDIDTTKDSDNYVTLEVILDEKISLDHNNIELKNISDINLYKVELKGNDEVTTTMEKVNIADLKENMDSYFVEIEMDYLPTTRARILNVIENSETNMLTLSLKYDYVTKEGTASQIIRVDFGTIADGVAINEAHPETAIKVLLEKLEKGDDVTLNRNYDASLINVPTSTYVSNNYSGHLNGNGYTISNLTKPLFNVIEKGSVENLRIDTVNMTSTTDHGTIANVATEETIKKVYINSVTRTNASTETGLLVGKATRSTIEECRVINFKMSDAGGWPQSIGTLIGSVDSSTIKNCYVNGSLSASWNYVGGFVGNAVGNTYLINNYSKVNYSNGYTNVGCSFVCSTNGAVIAQNNIDVGTSGSRIKAFTNNFSKDSSNNYYLLRESETIDINGVTGITADQVNAELFKEANFDPNLWNLRNTSLDNLPSLIDETKTNLETIDGYESDKEILYNNLKKLTPFYDDNKIVEAGKNITNELLLNEEITHIIPLAKDGSLVTYLTTAEPKTINTIKIIFKGGKKAEFGVTYDKTYDMVATYKINDLNIDYNYNHYVIDADSQVVNNLTNYLQGLNYTDNLDILTTNNDSRIYRDFYNETTKNELKQFVLKYLSNSNYTNTSNDSGINNYIEREVKQDKRIEKALYTYNYFRRFYDLEVDGMKLYDFVLFNMQGFNESLTISKITDLYFSNSTGANFNTDATDARYVDLLSKYTGLSHISDLLEFIVTNVSDYNMDDWAASQFKGVLVEVPVEGHEDDIDYTLWDHLSTEDAAYSGSSYRVYNYVLPILTLPDKAGYIISAPAQFTIGSQRIYMSDPTDPTQFAPFKERMDAYVGRISSYYNTIYDILGDKELLNNMHLYQIDKRTTKDETGASVFNMPYTTEEPFHKNFNEIVNLWPANYGVNAGNWGDHLEWNVAGFMDSPITTDGTIDQGHPTFMTWSHETAHYFDARLFLQNNGRRFNAGGEDYCEGFLMQQFGPRDIVMNLTVNYRSDQKVASNMTTERINSKAKIQDFYSKVFETLYVMDYIEAQAFLKLTDEQKEVVGFQVNYPNEETLKDKDNFYEGRLTTQYKQLSKEEWANIELKDINDLIDKRIAMVPGLYKVGSRGANLYGGEGIANIHWYQPWNPDGRPDSYSLKWISYEMLGYAGYDDGFVEYASNIGNITNGSIKNYKTDLMALQKITGYDSMDDYKKYRFSQTRDKLGYLKYVDVDQYAQRFYDALVLDAKTMQEDLDRIFASNGGEDKCLTEYWCTRSVGDARGYKNSSAVREELYFALKNATNDFRGDIFDKEIQQEVDFNINTSGE